MELQSRAMHGGSSSYLDQDDELISLQEKCSTVGSNASKVWLCPDDPKVNLYISIKCQYKLTPVLHAS